MEDSGAEGDLNCGDLAKDVLEENNCSCNISGKNVTAFCPTLDKCLKIN